MEVLLDDAYWPCFSTTRARSLHAQWEHVGEGFIKELDFGRVWLRLNENEEGEKDDIISEYKCDAKDFLEQALVSCSLHIDDVLNCDFMLKHTTYCHRTDQLNLD